MSFLIHDKFGEPHTLEGNEVCATAQYVFSNGQCHAFAFAAHEKLGYTIFVGKYPCHLAVVSPDGFVLDVNGWQVATDFLAKWRWDGHTLESAGELCDSIQDAENTIRELGLVEANIEVAHHFVDVVLETSAPVKMIKHSRLREQMGMIFGPQLEQAA